MGAFQAFYDSAWHHPFLLWVAGVVGIAIALSRRDLSPSLWRYCAALGALTLADAWLTSERVIGIGPLSGWAGSAVPLFFVLAGDLRYLLLVTAADDQGRVSIRPRIVAGAVGLTVIVPIVSRTVVALLPESHDGARVLYLVYELSFVLLTLGLMRFHRNVCSIAWLGSVSRFVALYYGLWAGSDLIILATGSDLGFGLRVVPNVLYYGGLIAVMGRAAPARV